jgi:hypothetical protein
MLEYLKKRLKQGISQEQKEKLHRFVGKSKIIGFFSIFFSKSLTRLAIIYGTDKWGNHYYTPHYQFHLHGYKYKKIKLLEIGVGGYTDPNKGGESLRMWKRYFPFGKIFSMDIYDKSPQEESRIKIFKGSQVDYPFLDSALAEMGDLDIIIDDGSHINEHVINTFKYLFPKLKSGGMYIIEDTQTSYAPAYGGTSENLKTADTIMNFFKQMPDSINYKEFKIENYQPNYYDLNITAIHFYHNLIFIEKNSNNR